MDAYSIIDRSPGTATHAAGVLMTESKQETRQKPGNTLSIADSARRDVEATLQLLAERAQYITGASGAAIALRNGNRVLCRASSGSASPELGSYLDLSSGLSGECVRTRTLLSCGDTANDPRVDRESCRRLGIASLAVMPILRNDSVIGIFEIFSNRANTFHERDLLALERLQDMVNIALDQAAPDAPTAAPFAVHGTKVKVLAVAAGAGSAAKSTIVADQDADGLHDRLGFIDGLPGTTAAARPDRSKPVERIRSCTSCGFPVSEGRVLCLDCESKGSQARGTGFLAPPSPQPQKGIKSWILTNRYIIGMVLISAATIAFALLH